MLISISKIIVACEFWLPSGPPRGWMENLSKENIDWLMSLMHEEAGSRMKSFAIWIWRLIAPLSPEKFSDSRSPFSVLEGNAGRRKSCVRVPLMGLALRFCQKDFLGTQRARKDFFLGQRLATNVGLPVKISHDQDFFPRTLLERRNYTRNRRCPLIPFFLLVIIVDLDGLTKTFLRIFSGW